MNYPNLPPEDYFGKGKPRGENELDSLRLVRPEVSRQEPDLYLTKWWDYRLMHHVEATRYWASCYARAVKDFCQIAHDMARAESARPFNHADILQTREATAAVTARQHMDRIGCRYPWAFKWLTNRFIEHGWRAFPRPNQLYGDELILDLADAWALESRASLQIPHARAFRSQSKLRDDYSDWALEQACARSQPGLVWMPVSRLLSEGVLDPQRARSRIGASALDRAMAVARLS